jgi:hypothetical protein
MRLRNCAREGIDDLDKSALSGYYTSFTRIAGPMNLRVSAGFFLAPIAPCALYATAMSVFANQWSGFLVIVVAMVAVSEAVSLVVAVPLFLFLRRLRRIGLVECITSGVAIAVLLSLISGLFSGGPGYSAADGGGPTVVDGHLTVHGFANDLVGTAIQSVLGAVIGLCFWLIAVRGNNTAVTRPQSRR